MSKRENGAQLTADGKELVLGKRYRDTVHGTEGVAVSRHQYLAGCDRVALESVVAGEIKANSFDIVQIQEIPDAPQVPEHRRRGGPARYTPTR